MNQLLPNFKISDFSQNEKLWQLTYFALGLYVDAWHFMGQHNVDHAFAQWLIKESFCESGIDVVQYTKFFVWIRGNLAIILDTS